MTAKEKFKKGDRVRPTPSCPISAGGREKEWVVDGFCRSDPNCIRVRHFRIQNSVPYHMDFWERFEEGQ